MINQTQRQNTKECTHINETLIGNLKKIFGYKKREGACQGNNQIKFIKTNDKHLMHNLLQVY